MVKFFQGVAITLLILFLVLYWLWFAYLVQKIADITNMQINQNIILQDMWERMGIDIQI